MPFVERNLLQMFHFVFFVKMEVFYFDYSQIHLIHLKSSFLLDFTKLNIFNFFMRKILTDFDSFLVLPVFTYLLLNRSIFYNKIFNSSRLPKDFIETTKIQSVKATTCEAIGMKITS